MPLSPKRGNGAEKSLSVPRESENREGGALATGAEELLKRAAEAQFWSYPCIPSCAAQERDVEEL